MTNLKIYKELIVCISCNGELDSTGHCIQCSTKYKYINELNTKGLNIYFPEHDKRNITTKKEVILCR